MDAAEFGHSCSRHANVITDHVNARSLGSGRSPRAVLHRYLSAPGQRRVRRHRALRRRPSRARVGVHGRRAALSGGAAARPSGARADANLVEIPSVAFPPYPDIRLAAPAYGRIAEVVREFKPDIVHSATEFMIGRLGQIAAKRAGIVRLSSYHTDFSRYTEAYGMPWLRPAVSRYIARFHRRSARVFTPSAPAREDLIALGVSTSRCGDAASTSASFSPTRRSQPLRARVRHRRVGGVSSRRTPRRRKGRGQDRSRVSSRARLLPAGAARLIIAGAGPGRGRAAVARRTGRAVSRRARSPAVAAATVRERRRVSLLVAHRDAGPRRARGDGERTAGDRDARGRRRRSSARRAERHRRSRRRRRRDGERDRRADARRDRGARLADGARRTALALDWEEELDRLDASYRAVLVERRDSIDSVSRAARRIYSRVPPRQRAAF